MQIVLLLEQTRGLQRLYTICRRRLNAQQSGVRALGAYCCVIRRRLLYKGGVVTAAVAQKSEYGERTSQDHVNEARERA
jgi:hypothetical protein